MRNMSFALTVPQMRNRTKTVTRRRANTWQDLKPGDLVRAVEKSMGLKKGEKVKPIGVIEIVGVRTEGLYQVDVMDVAREGFPGMISCDFIEFLRKHTGIHPSDEVRRIEFRHRPGLSVCCGARKVAWYDMYRSVGDMGWLECADCGAVLRGHRPDKGPIPFEDDRAQKAPIPFGED